MFDLAIFFNKALSNSLVPHVVAKSGFQYEKYD
jgi:hypothetical protein